MMADDAGKRKKRDEKPGPREKIVVNEGKMRWIEQERAEQEGKSRGAREYA